MGGFALGKALSLGNNKSLQGLRLDYNGGATGLRSEGVINLCRGLCSNSSLLQLHLQFCGITADAGPLLGAVLANRSSALQVLKLGGNMLGGQGLIDLCRGLFGNRKLQELSLSDNRLDFVRIDVIYWYTRIAIMMLRIPFRRRIP
jgi:hypothetical protein